MTVTKVEPWNSVRVTLNISKDAALNLQRLAEEDGQLLRDLGILSVQLHGNQSVYVGESSHNDMTSETVANQFKETSGNETRMPCMKEPSDTGCGQRLFTSNSSWQSFTGKQEVNNTVMLRDCFQDGSQPLEHFVYPRGIESVSGCTYFGSPGSQSAAFYTENPDANFNFSNDGLAFRQVAGSAFDDVIVSQFCSSESKQSHEKVFLRERLMQSPSFALCSNQPLAVDHVRHRRFSGLKSSSAQNTVFNCALLQSYGTDVGTGIGNCKATGKRQWRNPRSRSSAAQRWPFKEEIIPRENASVMQRHAGTDPWLRGVSQEPREIYSGFKLAQSYNHHHQSLSSKSFVACPVTGNPVFAQQNSFQNTQYTEAADHHVQSNFLNNQINSAPMNHLAKSRVSTSRQMPVCIRPNVNPDRGKRRVSDTQNNSTTVQTESCGMALPEVHSPEVSAFSPASPEDLCNPEDGRFCDSATVLAAESSKLAVERALSLLSDTTDDAPSLPVEKECYHSGHFDLMLSLPTGSSYQGILGKLQPYSQESDCFTTRTQPISSVAPNQMQSVNHLVEFRRKSPSALKKGRFAESARRSMPCMNSANDDSNYILEPKSKTYDHANGYSCKGTASAFSNVASSTAMLEDTNQNNVDSRSHSNYLEGNRECGVAFYPDGNKTSLGTSFTYSTMSSPIQQDMVTVSSNPLMLPCDRFARSSKPSKFNFTQCSLPMGSLLSPSSATFPPAFPAVHDSLVRFTCRVKSQDKLQTTTQTAEVAAASSSPRDTCSWMESELCSSIPDSGIASNTSSGGSSDLSEVERTLGGSLENFNRYQEAAEAKDGCMPDGALEEGTDVADGACQTHSTIYHVQNTSCATTSHEAPPSLSVCRQATSPGRAVGFGNTESYMGIRNENVTSVVQRKHDNGMSFDQCRETLKKKAPGLVDGNPKKDNSVRMHTISKVSSMTTNSELADAYQSSRVKLGLARNSTNGESASRSCFEPLITCPSLPHRLSESVKLAMQGVLPVGTSSDTFTTRVSSAPMDAMQASTIIRITKTKSGGSHSKQKDTWSIQPVIRCRQEKQNNEKATPSGNCEMPRTPYTTESIKSPTAENSTLHSDDFNHSSQNITSSKNKLCSVRLKPGRNSIFATSLRTKKLETSRPIGSDRHKPWLKGQSGEFKQSALSGCRLLAERTVQNSSRTKAKRLNCVQMHSADS